MSILYSLVHWSVNDFSSLFSSIILACFNICFATYGYPCFCLDVRREPSPDSNTNTKTTPYKGEKIKETSDQVKIKVSSMIMSLSMHYLHLQFYSMVFVCLYTRKKNIMFKLPTKSWNCFEILLIRIVLFNSNASSLFP